MISIERTHTGGYTASALVSNGSFAWYEWNTYYGYPKREIAKLFREYLKGKNLTIVKGLR
jgi:hypothetical protein